MRLFPKRFPDDEDGHVLKMLYKEGLDFKEEQNVDFFVAVPDQESGQSVLEVLKNEGYNCELEQDEESGEWTCFCFIRMLLNYDEIVAIQKRLDELSKPYGGLSDGWGVMVD
jgi:hypothetical protein